MSGGNQPRRILRPSGSYQWSNCAGSHELAAQYPEEEGEEAREGTAAHFYATELVQGRNWPVGTITPNGVPINDEMIEAGEVFYRAVCEHCAGAEHFAVEQKLTMHNTVHPDNEGTPDVWSASFAQRKISMIDFKYGHRYVEEYQNTQCIDYLAGVFERLGLTREVSKGWEIVVAIVQPRNYHHNGPVRVWRALGWQIWEEIAELREAAYRAKEPNAQTRTGPWCRDCSARHACEALRRVGGYALDLAGSSIPSELPDDALGLQLRLVRAAIKRLEAMESGLAADALARMRRGGRLAGLQIEQGEGREAWTVPAAEVYAMGDIFGVNLRKEGTLTPQQARKAGISSEIVETYARRPPGEHKVTEVTAAQIAKTFR